MRQHHRLLQHRLAGAPVAGLSRARSELVGLQTRLDITVDGHLGETSRRLAAHAHALQQATQRHVGDQRARLAGLEAALRTTDPRNVLERGYGMLQQPDGSVIDSVSDLAVGDGLLVHLVDGTVTTAIEDVKRT